VTGDALRNLHSATRCDRPVFPDSRATLRHRRGRNDALRLWAGAMSERKTVKYKFKLTAGALANKVARIVIALMTRGGQYDDRPVAAGPPRRAQQGEFSPQGDQHPRRRRVM